MMGALCSAGHHPKCIAQGAAQETRVLMLGHRAMLRAMSSRCSRSHPTAITPWPLGILCCWDALTPIEPQERHAQDALLVALLVLALTLDAAPPQPPPLGLVAIRPTAGTTLVPPLASMKDAALWANGCNNTCIISCASQADF